MLPATAASQCSFVENLAVLESPEVADATVFVSHAWACRFLDVVGALAAWEARRPPAAPKTYFWFDIFSNPQHGAVDRPFEWWSTTFAENVGRIGRTLLVLAWEDPKPLSRAWCLVEIVASISKGAALEVVMAPHEEALFEAALEHEFDAILGKACAVDVEKATAYHGGECLVGGRCEGVEAGKIAACPGDLARIKQSTREGIGFERTNACVIQGLRQWMASAGEAALARIGSGGARSTSPIIAPFARLLVELGDFDRARALLDEALAGRLAVSAAAAAAAAAPGSSALARAAAASAAHLALELQLERSEVLLRTNLAASGEVLALRRHAYEQLCASPQAGEDAPLTLRAGHALGELLGRSAVALHDGFYDVKFNKSDKSVEEVQAEAVALLKRVAAARERVLGADHRDTRATHAALASLTLASGRGHLLENSLAALVGRQQALRISEALRGASAIEDRERALFLSRKALADAEALRGPEHPETLREAAALGALLQSLGMRVMALELLERALKGRKKMLGEDHPDTLESYHELGCALGCLGDGDSFDPMRRPGSRAEELLQTAYDKRRAHDKPRAAESGAALAEFWSNDPCQSHEFLVKAYKLYWKLGEEEDEKAPVNYFNSAAVCCVTYTFAPCLRCCGCVSKIRGAERHFPATSPLTSAAIGEPKA